MNRLSRRAARGDRGHYRRPTRVESTRQHRRSVCLGWDGPARSHMDIDSVFLQVPRHWLLLAGYDAHRALVALNWIKTIAWPICGELCLS